MSLKNCVLFSARVVLKCDIAYLICPIVSLIVSGLEKGIFTSVLHLIKILKQKHEHMLHMKHEI